MTLTINKKDLLNQIQTENDYIMDLLLSFNVPDSIEEDDCDEYLLQNDRSVAKKTSALKPNIAAVDELQDRLNLIKNKMKAKKKPMSERAQKKREAKKLKKNKEFKKVLVSAAKSIKNENQKQSNSSNSAESKGINTPTPKPIFNEEGKMVFSKFDFASHPGAKVKKSHQNPKEMLKKLKDTQKKLNELKETGEADKAAKIKNDLSWQKAFDKVEGKKVKDDPTLLYKAIKKRKDEKKKSKQKWTERKTKVESTLEQRQKKRQDNINKRIKDKKVKKLKKMSKKGRVIPGF